METKTPLCLRLMVLLGIYLCPSPVSKTSTTGPYAVAKMCLNQFPTPSFLAGLMSTICYELVSKWRVAGIDRYYFITIRIFVDVSCIGIDKIINLSKVDSTLIEYKIFCLNIEEKKLDNIFLCMLC